MNIDIEKFEQMMRAKNLNHLLSEQAYLSNKIEDLKLVVSSQQRLIKLHEENLSSYQALKVDYEKLQAPGQMSLDKSFDEKCIEELKIAIQQPVNELTRRRRQLKEIESSLEEFRKKDLQNSDPPNPGGESVPGSGVSSCQGFEFEDICSNILFGMSVCQKLYWLFVF
jgi:uncharacterized coiled-coil protein SlyX